jgi:5'-deoxynucleotidase
MPYHFYAFLSRMKYINRWGLMRNTKEENISEHSLEVAMIAHALCVISNTYFQTGLNADRAAAVALFHDANEIITGDIPTPIKYFNPQIQKAYQAVEDISKHKLLDMLPDELKQTYRELFYADKELLKRVKWADRLCAYIKCIEEKKAGNSEFNEAKDSIERQLKQIDAPEVKLFLTQFIPSYFLSVDEQD